MYTEEAIENNFPMTQVNEIKADYIEQKFGGAKYGTVRI